MNFPRHGWKSRTKVPAELSGSGEVSERPAVHSAEQLDADRTSRQAPRYT